jgi:hypothetical protein
MCAANGNAEQRLLDYLTANASEALAAARGADQGGAGMKALKLNPRTTPLGVLLVNYLPEAQAAIAASHLATPAVIREAFLAEVAGRMRHAVLMAMAERLSMIK